MRERARTTAIAIAGAETPAALPAGANSRLRGRAPAPRGSNCSRHAASGRQGDRAPRRLVASAIAVTLPPCCCRSRPPTAVPHTHPARATATRTAAPTPPTATAPATVTAANSAAAAAAALPATASRCTAAKGSPPCHCHCHCPSYCLSHSAVTAEVMARQWHPPHTAGTGHPQVLASASANATANVAVTVVGGACGRATLAAVCAPLLQRGCELPCTAVTSSLDGRHSPQQRRPLQRTAASRRSSRRKYA